MSQQIRRRRGTTAQHAAFTGAGAELTVDTDKNTVVVHDGMTAGGHPLAKEAALATRVRVDVEQVFTAIEKGRARANVDALGPNESADRAFRRGNILGTVSQAGGVPTGAVVERGSNANGEYVRFADGTQICCRVTGVYSIASPAGNIFVNGAATGRFNWPAAFSIDPFEQVTAHKLEGTDGHAWAASVNRPSPTESSSIQLFRATSNSDVFFVSIIAVGRWF